MQVLSFLRRPFGKPFGELRVVSAVESTHGPEPVERAGIHEKTGFRVKPGMTELRVEKAFLQAVW